MVEHYLDWLSCAWRMYHKHFYVRHQHLRIMWCDMAEIVLESQWGGWNE